MGGQGSKTSAAQPSQDASKRSLNEGTQAQSIGHGARQHSGHHFDFGKTSEFWFMLRVENPWEHSAEELHRWITDLVGDTTSQICGVKYLKDGEFVGTPAYVFLFGKDLKTTQFVWNCLPNSKLAIRGISKAMCMDEPSKSTPKVSASAEQVKDRKFGDDSNYTSTGMKISDHRKTPDDIHLNSTTQSGQNLEKTYTSSKFMETLLAVGASQKIKTNSSRDDTDKVAIQDKEINESHQTNRTSYEAAPKGCLGKVALLDRMGSINIPRRQVQNLGNTDPVVEVDVVCSSESLSSNEKLAVPSDVNYKENALVVKADKPKTCSNTRLYNSNKQQIDTGLIQQAEPVTCDSDFWPKSKKESLETLPQNQKEVFEANNDVESSREKNNQLQRLPQQQHSFSTHSGVSSKKQNFLNFRKPAEAAFLLFNTADQPSTGDTFVKDGGSLNESEATVLSHIKGDFNANSLPSDAIKRGGKKKYCINCF